MDARFHGHDAGGAGMTQEGSDTGGCRNGKGGGWKWRGRRTKMAKEDAGAAKEELRG
ncbi:hypothetical protein [Rickettsiales endosymbiont of Peranema trichophorum]|uniref:hypothetical protein n=1 Tax=Rickettsiales endosymbiont of Peranema trichophorum TaxID=2486577 RepID=UPI0013EEBCF9|nr:hypothetical protein [Rickettsiales endosymbiont of Peranema trichophorum]